MKKITFLLLAFMVTSLTWAQCVKDNAFGTLALANDGTIEGIAGNQWSTEHSTVTGFVDGDDYLIYIQLVADGTNKYVTISESGNDANVLAFGQSPFMFTATAIADLKLSWSDDPGPACAGTAVSHATAVQNLTAAADACPDPINFAASNVTDSSADLDWLEQGISAVSYNVEVYLTGESAANGDTAVFADAAVSGTSVMATGLAATTGYDAYITTTCSGATAMSMLVGPVAFTTTAACSDVSGVGSANVTDATADVTWTVGTGNDSALVEVYATGESAANGDTAVYSNASATGGTDTATGLMAETVYDIFVTGFCGMTGTAVQGPSSFTTTPAAPVCGGSFVDSGGAANDYSSNETITWTICPDNPGDVVTVDFTAFSAENNGTGCYDGLTIHNGADDMATTIDPPAGGTIWCWDRDDATPTGSGDLQGMMITSTDPSGCITLVFTSDGSVTREGWEAAVTCAPPPACVAPAALAAANIMDTTADLSWTESGSAMLWDIEIVDVTAMGMATGMPTTSGVTNPYTAMGLTENNMYEYYVRADCGGGSTSTWSGPFAFMTIETCPAPSALTATNIMETSADLGWTENGAATSWNIEIVDVTAMGMATGTPTASGVMNPYAATLTSSNSYEYYVQADCGVDGVSAWAGPFAFTTPGPPPANNDCGNASMLTAGAVFTDNPVVGTNANTTDSGEMPLPGCAAYDPADASGNGGDIWYAVTVPADGNLTIETDANPTGNGGDGGMAVYTGSCGSLALFECDDDDGPGLYGQVIIEPADALANQVVYIRVWEFSGDAIIDFQVSAYSATLGVDDVSDNTSFTYYPNPVKNTLTLSAQNTIENVAMYNMLGQEVLRATPNAIDSDLDMSSLQAGTYFVQVTIASITKTVRVIKQ